METLKQAFRYLIYPLLLIGAVSLFFAFKGSFPGTQLPLLTALISIGTIVIIHITERLLPYRDEWNTPRGDRLSNFLFTNIILPVLSKIVEILLAYIFLSSTTGFIHDHIHTLWPREWPLLAQLVMALLITEFFFYWIHRWGHTHSTLWKFHSIHHVVERLYWNNSGMFHPVDLFLNWLIYFAPLFVLGVPSDLIALFLLVNAVTGLLEHANIDYEVGTVNKILNTAQLHRWHHSVNPEVSAKNFGKVLSVWDVVFRTWYNPAGQAVDKIGVEGEPIPTSTLDRMKYPFQAIFAKAKK